MQGLFYGLQELESVKDKLVDCQKHVEGLNTEIHDLLRANLGHSRVDRITCTDHYEI